MKLSRLAVVLATAVALVGGSFAFSAGVAAQCGPVASAKGEVPTVQITGGTVTNDTTINLNADAGTGIADASGGNNNVAVTSGGDDLGDVASVGNGGTANASANGGAISVGNINSGGNSGNTITVGNTCAAPPPAKPEAPKPEAPKKEAPKAEAPKAEKVRALPSTGVGLVEDETGANTGLIALALVAAAGAAGYSVRRRFV